MNTCTKRHQIECKNSSSCIFLKSNSYEFLHSESWQEQIRNYDIETLQIMNDDQRARLGHLEKKLNALENISNKSAEKVKALEAKLTQEI